MLAATTSITTQASKQPNPTRLPAIDNEAHRERLHRGAEPSTTVMLRAPEATRKKKNLNTSHDASTNGYRDQRRLQYVAHTNDSFIACGNKHKLYHTLRPTHNIPQRRINYSLCTFRAQLSAGLTQR